MKTVYPLQTKFAGGIIKMFFASSLSDIVFIMLINVKMPTQHLIKTKISSNKDVSCFKSLRYCIYHANKC